MCTICRSKTKRFYDEETKCFYEKCTNCDFTMKDVSFDHKEDLFRYKQHNNVIEDDRYVDYFLRIKERIEKHIKLEGLLLDYGAGENAVFAQILNEKGIDTKTYDLFFPHSEDYDQFDYDIIIMIEVAEHFVNPLEDLGNAIRLLETGGFLVIHTYTIEEPFTSWWYRRDPTHRSFYTIKTMDEIANYFSLEKLHFDDKLFIFRKS